MEVQDINQSQAAALFNKNNAVSSSANAVGNGFAGFLGQLGADLVPGKETEQVVRERPQAKVEKEKTATEKQRPEAKKNEKRATSDSPSVKERPVKEKATQSEDISAPVAVAVAQAPQTAQPVDSEAADVENSSAVESEDWSGVDVKSQQPADSQAVVGGTDISDEKIDVISAIQEELPPAVKNVVENLQNGEMPVAQESEAVLKVINDFDEDVSDEVSQALVETAESELESVIEKKDSNLPQMMQTPKTRTADAAEIKEDKIEEKMTPISELEEKLGVEIKVAAREEKAASSVSELLKDRFVLSKTVVGNEVLTENNGDTVANAAAVNNGASPVETGETSLQGFAALQSMESEDMSALSLSTDNAGRSMSTAASSSVSGFVSAAKSEMAVAKNETTFKDVYKGLGREAAEQIKVNITKSAVRGIDKIDIRLKPEELGNIEIKMQLAKDGRLNAHIIASRPETIELLQKETAILEQAFRDAGFQTEDGGLNFSLRDNGQTGEQREQNSGLRDFLGQALEEETSTELAAVSGGDWSGTGLNIRV